MATGDWTPDQCVDRYIAGLSRAGSIDNYNIPELFQACNTNFHIQGIFKVSMSAGNISFPMLVTQWTH